MTHYHNMIQLHEAACKWTATTGSTYARSEVERGMHAEYKGRTQEASRHFANANRLLGYVVSIN